MKSMNLNKQIINLDEQQQCLVNESDFFFSKKCGFSECWRKKKWTQQFKFKQVWIICLRATWYDSTGCYIIHLPDCPGQVNSQTSLASILQ